MAVLDCCRTGNVAFFDKETGEVLGYQKIPLYNG